jgi:hypothetical protein
LPPAATSPGALGEGLATDIRESTLPIVGPLSAAGTGWRGEALAVQILDSVLDEVRMTVRS